MLGVNSILYLFLTKDVVYEKYIYNEESIENYNVFILSDSHGEALKNLTNKFSIYNFSYVGDNYQDMYYKLCFLSSHLDSKDIVLITVNNHTLSTYRDVSSNTVRNLIYVNNIDNVFDESLMSEYKKSKFFRKMPLLEATYGKFYLDYIKNHLKSDFFDDMSFADVSIPIKKKQIRSRFEQQFGDDNTSEKGLFFLNKIIEISENYNFRLIGIKYPVSSLYYETIKNHDMNAEKVLLLNNIETIDLQKEYSFSDNMFKDQDHLNKKGAKVFLQKLSTFLNIKESL